MIEPPSLLENHILIVKNLPKHVDNLATFLNTPAREIKPFGKRRVLLYYDNEETAEEQKRHLDERGLKITKFFPNKTKSQSARQLKINKTTQTPKIKRSIEADETLESLNKAFCNNELNFKQPPPPQLKYVYPPITPEILKAISIALVENKRFYTQVLHLMNRMNLDPPFEAKETASTVLEKLKVKLQKAVATQTEGNEELVQESESELESSGDEQSKTRKERPIKRKLATDTEEAYKKKARQVLVQSQKIKPLIEAESTHLNNISTNTLREAFPEKKNIKKIDLRINEKTQKPMPVVASTSYKPPTDLPSHQMSVEDLKNLPIYKNYDVGVPSNKLYIKNLAKQVTTADIASIYKRFVEDPSHLDVKVMQQGRMKGQAFISFNRLSAVDTHEIVSKALRATHGLVLFEKPMIVCYGKQS